MNYTDLAYRRTAVEGASGFGLMIALYDTLVGDLRRGAEAQRAGNIEKRAKELKHALLVVGFLQNWIDPESGDLAQRMIAFYAKTRKVIVEAQVRQSAEMLETLMAETLDLRRLWQQLDLRGAASAPEILPPVNAKARPAFSAAQMDHRQLSWSA
jgi:flagellar biosynthetic protein FliS